MVADNSANGRDYGDTRPRNGPMVLMVLNWGNWGNWGDWGI